MEPPTTSPPARPARALPRVSQRTARTPALGLLAAALLWTWSDVAVRGDETPLEQPNATVDASSTPPHATSDVANQPGTSQTRTPIRRGVDHDAPHAARGTAGSLISSFANLGLILAGLYLVLAWLRRRQSARAATSTAAIDVLASRRLDPQGTLHLVRIGQRVLAVGSSPAGLQTLAAFDDPQEIATLIAASDCSTAGISPLRVPFRNDAAGAGRDAASLTPAAATGASALGRVA